MPYATPWLWQHSPHHPFLDSDYPWPPAARECLNQCADQHLHYCGRKQEPTDHPGCRDALVTLFHASGTREPGPRLMHPGRAKQDAHTGQRVTPEGLHFQVGGYRRKGNLCPPTQGAVYHLPAAHMYILRDVLVDGEHRAPHADVASPEPLRPRPQARTPVWLVTTDEQCVQAAECAKLSAKWGVVQVGVGPWNYAAVPPC